MSKKDKKGLSAVNLCDCSLHRLNGGVCNCNKYNFQDQWDNTDREENEEEEEDNNSSNSFGDNFGASWQNSQDITH